MALNKIQHAPKTMDDKVSAILRSLRRTSEGRAWKAALQAASRPKVLEATVFPTDGLPNDKREGRLSKPGASAEPERAAPRRKKRRRRLSTRSRDLGGALAQSGCASRKSRRARWSPWTRRRTPTRRPSPTPRYFQ